jgi:uncharacterized membrane protein YqiK
MPTHTKHHDGHSPLDILTELAVEGTSSLIEAQRTLLNLAQQENDIILNGLKGHLSGFMPGVAMTDLVRRSLDTLLGMQQELLTTTSRQTLEWLESERAGKGKRAAHLVEFAREGVESFTRAQKKFLDVVAEEGARLKDGKPEHEAKPAKKVELAHLAREAGNAFIEAQKRLLDVMGQQMNVNLDATIQTMELASPSRMLPMANFTGEGVKNFVDAQKALLGSLVTPRKKSVGHPGEARRRTVRHKAVPA